MRRTNQRKVLLNRQPHVVIRKKTISQSNSGFAPKTTRGTMYQIASANPHAKLCIIRSVGGIGDILMTLPAVAQLREDFPHAYIIYATDRHSTHADDYYQIIRNAPFINEVIDARYVQRHLYDSCVDISSVCVKYEHSKMPPLNRIDIFARACGIPKLKNPVPYYRVEPDEFAAARLIVDPIIAAGKKPVFLHTASFDKKRCWTPARYEELILNTAQQRPDITFLVSDFNHVLPKLAEYPNVVDVTSPKIREVAATIAVSKLFIGPDSGPMHLAGTLYHPSLCLFGSIPASARINYYKNSTAITAQPKLSCMPCWYAKCDRNFACMSNISWQQVFNSMIGKL